MKLMRITWIHDNLYICHQNHQSTPENIFLTPLNYDTGLKSSIDDKNTIIEALKEQDINNIKNNDLISISDRDTLIKFRQFY